MIKRFTFLLISTVVAVLCLLTTSKVLADEYWDQKVSLFDTLPVYPNDIIFLGNSITDGGEFNELLKMENVKNRGIRSDVINGVKKRLDQVTKGHPKKIFLLIGINDVAQGVSVTELARRYEGLIDAIREQSPDTKLYVQSLMPVNNSFGRYKSLAGKESTIKKFNKEIERIANEKGATYIDLWPYLSDANGRLKREYTNDGLHLKGAGYKAWIKGIEQYVRD